MNAGAQCGSEPRIPRHDQLEASRSAKPRDLAAKRDTIRRVIMPEHHAGQARRQTGDRLQRVRQAFRVREQPQNRQAGPVQAASSIPGRAMSATGQGAEHLAAAASRDAPRPGREKLVHRYPSISTVGLTGDGAQPSSGTRPTDPGRFLIAVGEA
jgi:hypothetical protein